jgi:hypothetical protein
MTGQNSRSPEKKASEVDRNAQRQRALEKLEALVLEALHSGPLIEVTPEYWLKKRRDFMRKHMSDPVIRVQFERLSALDDARWAARAEAAEAEGGYLGPEKSMKALSNLLHRSTAPGKRKQKTPKRS